MRVTAIETVRLGRVPNVIHVLIETDEGVVGLGETYFGAATVETYLHEAVAPYLLGKDPSEIATHARRLTAYVGSTGTGAEMRGNSAVDLALWDLRGKELGVPLWKLLGGLARDQIWVYNTCAGSGYMAAESQQETANWGLGKAGGSYEDLYGFLHHPVDLARNLQAEGYTGMKIWPFDVAAEAADGQRISLVDLERALDPFRQIRDALGSSMELLVELHGLWNLSSAKRILKALEEINPFWVEDPLPMDHTEGLRELRGAADVILAGGETLGGTRAFERLIDNRAVDIVITDLCWSGGLSAAVRVANLAASNRLGFAPHDCTGPVSMATSVHLALTAPNAVAQEVVRAFISGWYADLVTGLPVLVDGYVQAPTRPGHGIELRPERLVEADVSHRRTPATGSTVS
jgi:galactonate dehydratase